MYLNLGFLLTIILKRNNQNIRRRYQDIKVHRNINEVIHAIHPNNFLRRPLILCSIMLTIAEESKHISIKLKHKKVRAI